MKYRLIAAMVGAFCSLSCWSTDDSYYGPPPEPRPRCERFTSCATCTPALGCGWCQSGDKGLCTSEPDHCAGAASFSWTWELAFCPATPDGGADAWVGLPVDAADSANTADAATSSDAADAQPHE
jgi:hypothetical protein